MSSIVASSSTQTEMDTMHARYLAIQAERAAAPPKKTHAQLQDEQVAACEKQIASLRAEIKTVEAELAKKVPGTIRELKSLRDVLVRELQSKIAHKGTLYNGGVW